MSEDVIDPSRLGRTRLADGRQLGWAEWGPQDGVPVLLCPGAATSRWLGFGGGIVDDLRVRLISVDRPGLGASDPQPGRTLTDWALDVAQLSRLRGLSGLRVVGCSQGGPFALACATAGIATSAAVVSGTDELANQALAHGMAPEVAALVRDVAADPVQAADTFSRMGTAAQLWNMTLSMSADVDRVVYTEASFARAYKRALNEAFSQGPAGYARDTVLSMAPWPFNPGAITIPVDLWYGGQDRSPVHSPDWGLSLAGRIPTARRHFLPGAGGCTVVDSRRSYSATPAGARHRPRPGPW